MLEFFCIILAIWVAVLSILVFIHLDSASSRFFKLEKKQKELDELLNLYKKEGLASSSLKAEGGRKLLLKGYPAQLLKRNL